MAKIGQGVGKANINRIPDDLYRAVTSGLPATSLTQPVPGDLGTLSQEQTNDLLRGSEVQPAPRSLESRLQQLEGKPKGNDLGMER